MKKPKIRIEVVMIGGEWKVEFGFDNQFFNLDYGGSKVEAEWQARMLRKCFRNYHKTRYPVTKKIK